MPPSHHRLAILSDTHLAAEQAEYCDSFVTVRAAINAAAPDLVLHAGDVSSHGLLKPEQLVFARSAMDTLNAPVLCVPGNRDIGDHPRYKNPKRDMTAARYHQYADAFGADHWSEDVGVWRLIGLNSLIMDTGTPEAIAQKVWLKHRIAEAAGRPIGVIMHKPLFIDAPGAPFKAPLAVPAASCERLMALFAGGDLKWIVSGHLHQTRTTRHDGVEHVWAPSTAFANGHFAARNAEFVLGYLELVLDGTDYRFTRRVLDKRVPLRSGAPAHAA